MSTQPEPSRAAGKDTGKATGAPGGGSGTDGGAGAGGGGAGNPGEGAPGHRLRLVPVLLVLTAVSGIIDAVSYLGFAHVFTANMTGNVLVAGFAAAGSPHFEVTHALTSLGVFLAGALAGGWCDKMFRGAARRMRVRIGLVVEALLLGAAATVATATDGGQHAVYALIALTAFAMGVRNAVVRTLRVADMTTTTVLTMTITGLLADTVAHGHAQHAGRRIGLILALFAGAACGALLVLHRGVTIPLLVAAGLSGALALVVGDRD